jgi:hypothetical protein
MKSLPLLVISIGLMITGCAKEHEKENEVPKDITVVSGQGDINSKINEFRQILGVTINTTPGATGGHREVNWDALPAEVLGKALPLDFFNTVGDNIPASRQRGLVYGVEGGGEFRVSASNFADVNSAAAPQFAAFSGERTFSNISNNLWTGAFRVAGQPTIATVKGVGLVFSDVDKDNSTFIEFFNGNENMGKFFVPPHNNQNSFSFLGVYFSNKRVTNFRVGHEGRLVDGGKDISDGGTSDLIIMDDLFYDEPVAKD